MTREQMITHLTLCGWQPCRARARPFNFPRIVDRQFKHVMIIGLVGVFRDPFDGAADIPDNDWARYTGQQLRMFVAELDAEA